VVRQRAVGAARHDRRKRRLRAAAAHLGLDLERDIALASSGQAALRNAAQHLVGERGGRADRAQLPVLLDGAEALHEAPRGHQLGAVLHETLEPPVGPHGHRVVLEADPAREVPGRVLEQVLAPLLDVESVDLAPGLGHVAEVGQEHAPPLPHEGDAVGPGVAGQVTDVHEVRDEQGVELALAEQLGQAVGARHAAPPRASLRISSASR
jgi:hypothetical protein